MMPHLPLDVSVSPVAGSLDVCHVQEGVPVSTEEPEHPAKAEEIRVCALKYIWKIFYLKQEKEKII